MDQIRLTGVRAVGKHGVLDFEHERAQTFVVDATLFLDLAPAGHSDDLRDTVDYGAIAKGIVAIIEGEHVDLIEKLADRIASMILEYPAVAQTQVTVHKPSAPIVVPFDDVSVTVERSRETTSAASQVHHAIIAMGCVTRCVRSTDWRPLRLRAFRRCTVPMRGVCPMVPPTFTMRLFP